MSLASKDYIKNLLSKTVKKISPFKFGIEENNKYGYYTKDGEFKEFHYNEEWDNFGLWEIADFSTLDNTNYAGSVISYKNKLHMLGFNITTNHYVYEGNNTWTQLNPLPYIFYNGSAFIYNDELHIMGGSTSTNLGSSTQYHYKYNDIEDSWERLDDIPIKLAGVSDRAIIFNNNIYLFGTECSTTSAHQKWLYRYDGNEWTQLQSFNFNVYRSTPIVYNNEMHLLGGDASGYITQHLKYNGESWEKIATLPYSCNAPKAIVIGKYLYITGSNTSNQGKRISRFDGSSWTNLTSLTDGGSTGTSYRFVVHDNKAYIIGAYQKRIYQLPVTSLKIDDKYSIPLKILNDSYKI